MWQGPAVLGRYVMVRDLVYLDLYTTFWTPRDGDDILGIFIDLLHSMGFFYIKHNKH